MRDRVAFEPAVSSVSFPEDAELLYALLNVSTTLLVSLPVLSCVSIYTVGLEHVACPYEGKGGSNGASIFKQNLSVMPAM